VTGVAPDGSPVELYARLPPLGEPELIHDAVPAGAEILELGAGAGRVTHPLLALGHPVVAVDNSAAMLALIQGAEVVHADIESLDLGRRFPVVVLASNFVNQPDRTERRALLSSCARHVLPDGQVLLQGFPREWTPRTEWVEHGEVRLRLRRFTLDGDLVSGEMEYIVGGRQLLHEFESKLLRADELDEDLRAVGLRRRRELDETGSWIEAGRFSADADKRLIGGGSSFLTH
jgi:SAM-dependent methyltransferase